MSAPATLPELIERLQALADELGDDAAECRIRIASQPHYPLASLLGAVALQRHSRDEGRTGDVLWIGAAGVGSHEHPYAPTLAFEDEMAWCGDAEGDDDEDEREDDEDEESGCPTVGPRSAP